MERQFFGVLLAAVLAANVGCNDKPAPPVAPPQSPTSTKQPAPSPSQQASSAKSQDSVMPTPATPSPPLVPANSIEDPPVIGTPQEAFNFPRQPIEMPKVLLTNGETKSSLVKVGDKMPEIALPDLAGKPQQLSKLMGEKLTVVAFWNTVNPYAVEEMGDLGPIVGKRFGSHGVQIVGIVERSSPTAAKAALSSAGAEFVNLVDANGKALEKVASAELPRTYLLDADGKVLWFDLEYSRSTRRDLVRAIQFALLNDK